MKICVCQLITDPETKKIKHVDNIIDVAIVSVTHWKEGCLISDGKGLMYRRSKAFADLKSIHGWEKHP